MTHKINKRIVLTWNRNSVKRRNKQQNWNLMTQLRCIFTQLDRFGNLTTVIQKVKTIEVNQKVVKRRKINKIDL